MAYNIETITNQYGSKAILLRHAQRDGNKIRKKTIANLSRFPPEIVQGFRAILKGGTAVANIHDHLTIQRSLPHGHVKAALGTARQLGLEKILHRSPSRERSLALAALITRLIAPESKLATARTLSDKSATSSLGSLLKLGDVAGNDMLATLDWLLARQPRIEQALARRHLDAATLLLYDVSSTYLEGSQCPLARFGLQPGQEERQATAGLRTSVYNRRLSGGG